MKIKLCKKVLLSLMMLMIMVFGLVSTNLFVEPVHASTKKVITTPLDFTSSNDMGSSASNKTRSSTLDEFGYDWDKEKKIFTMDGATIDASAQSTAEELAYAIKFPAGTTLIMVEGSENIIKSGKSTNDRGISSAIYIEEDNNSDLDTVSTIKGNGTLQLIANEGKYSSDGLYVASDSLVIESGTIYAKGESSGISVSENLTIGSGSITAIGKNMGLFAIEIFINGGTVNANTEGWGIFGEVSVIVSGGIVTVNATGTDAMGIIANNEIKFTGGKTTIKSDNCAMIQFSEENNITADGAKITASETIDGVLSVAEISRIEVPEMGDELFGTIVVKGSKIAAKYAIINFMADDEESLKSAKNKMETLLSTMDVSNDTTAKNILDAVTDSISSVDGVTASWKAGSPIITPATKDKTGSISGTILLTCGNETVEVDINKAIAKILKADKEKVTEAKQLAESAITAITVTNDTTAKNILDAVTDSISSVDGVKVSWKAGSPVITPATKDKAGSITGTLVLTCGSETVEVTVNKIINKLSTITNIVDNTTGVKVEYTDGSAFDSEAQLVVTPKTKEEMEKYQGKVNGVATGMTIGGLYDIKLLKDGVEVQPNGKLKITLILTDSMKLMSDLQAVYIDDNGKVTIIPSQLVDGKLVFITDHFSYYGVIGKIKPSSPQTGDASNTMLYVGMIVLSGCLVGWGLRKKHYQK